MSTSHWSLLRGFEAGAIEVAVASKMGSFQGSLLNAKSEMASFL